MKFLNAKNVRLEKHTGDEIKGYALNTKDAMTQEIEVEMDGKEISERVCLKLAFAKSHPIPKKLSISVNQYTDHPYAIDVYLIKRGYKDAYSIIKMSGLRTIFELEPDTSRIVFSLYKHKNDGKSTKIRFSVNYVSY